MGSRLILWKTHSIVTLFSKNYSFLTRWARRKSNRSAWLPSSYYSMEFKEKFLLFIDVRDQTSITPIKFQKIHNLNLKRHKFIFSNNFKYMDLIYKFFGCFCQRMIMFVIWGRSFILAVYGLFLNLV